MKEWEHLTEEECPTEMRFLSLKIRWLQRDLINAYKYLTNKSKEEGTWLISEVLSDRTIGSGHKLKYRRLLWNAGKHLSTERVSELLHRLSRDVVGASVLY